MKLKKTIGKVLGLCACALYFAGTAQAQNTNQWDPQGQWDFNNGDLTASVGANPLQYRDGDTTAGTVFGTADALGIPRLNGTNVSVMKFPASSGSGGYNLPTSPNPNGGGSLVNTYTIIMDVLFPSSSDGVVRPLVQTDEQEITPDADLVVDSSGGIGAPPGPYNGSVKPNTWYRIGFSVTPTEIDEYIDGVKVNTQQTGGVDSRFALTPGGFAWLFQNSTLNGAAAGYVSSIQVQDIALNTGQMAALGAASASKISTNSPAVPSFLESESPAPNEADVTPLPVITATLNAGGTTINPGSATLNFDGAPITTSVTDTGSNYVLTATITNLLLPYSVHTASVSYADSVVGQQTNSWSFSICTYQNINLPAPIYLETFDEVANGGIPAGWTVTNNTTTLVSGLNLFDTQSDTYKNWVTIDTADYAAVYPDTGDYISPGFPEVSGNLRQMIPPIVENGVLLTNLASGQLMVAESDQRGGNQVQVMFTKDYDFTSWTNVYVSFHNLNEQNQDNMCGVEYSVDQGATWQPLLYMMDDGTTDSDGSDVVRNPVTGEIDAVATFTADRADQAYGQAFGAFIGATISTNLAPFIRPCRNDDPVQQKRIELFRLPLADNQPNVRLRFVQAGTGSWFFDIDNLGFYSIPNPVINQQPNPVDADYNSSATFSVQASGDDLTYQWQFNSTNIAGATNTTYSIANCATNNVGLYSVGVTNSYGGLVSAAVALTLVYTPVVLTAPQDATITIGETNTLTVSARGGQPLSYQWLFNSNAIPGATGTNYAIVDAQATNTGSYQVLVSNQFSTVLSPIANVNVFAGSITQDMVVHLTFDNTYADSSGRGNNSTNVGTPDFEPGFLGQAIHVSSSGSPENNPATNNYVTLGYPSDLAFGSDPGASDFSFSFWTKINYQNDDKPFMGNKDWDSGGNPGWVLASEGGGMKWNYRDDAVNQPGLGSARRDSLTAAPQLEDGGWHHVVVTMARHSYGRIYVDGVLVDQSALGTDSPTNIVGSADTGSLGFNINIGQDGTGTYTDGTGGAALDMLVDDLAIWRRVVADQEVLGVFNAGLHSNTVDQATLTTPGAMPMITLQPQDAGTNQGAHLKLYVSALGSPALAYQWYFGTTPLDGGTNSAFTITNMQDSLAGNYSVVITNNYGAVTSRLAAVTYTGVVIPLPSISLQPVSQYVTPGATVSFTVATTTTGVSYQWLENGSAITDATNATLSLTNVQSANQGAYVAQVTGAGGTTNANPALLNVFTGTLNNGLVAYLPFDNDYKDYSGRGHNGRAVGSPAFAAGRIGGALHFSVTNDLSTNNYVTLGYPADLQFSTNDFSVGFWLNVAPANHGDDPALVANKSWSSSGNPGWGIFSQGGGNIRVNAFGNSGTKQDTTGTPIVCDGTWHFVLTSFWRGQYAAIYVDGNLVLNSPLTFSGAVDTVTNGYAINIGQDGTGSYTDNHDSSLHIDGLIDEVMLWNRVVTAPEVSSLYKAGTNNLTPLMLVTNSAYSTGAYSLGWHGGVPPFTLESNTNLSNTNWIPAGSTTSQSISITPGGAAGYFRIRGNNQ